MKVEVDVEQSKNRKAAAERTAQSQERQANSKNNGPWTIAGGHENGSSCSKVWPLVHARMTFPAAAMAVRTRAEEKEASASFTNTITTALSRAKQGKKGLLVMKLAKDAFDSNHIDTSATPDAAIVRIMDSNSTSCHQEQVRPKRKKLIVSWRLIDWRARREDGADLFTERERKWDWWWWWSLLKRRNGMVMVMMIGWQNEGVGDD